MLLSKKKTKDAQCYMGLGATLVHVPKASEFSSAPKDKYKSLYDFAKHGKIRPHLM
jgi:hypothetical protein